MRVATEADVPRLVEIAAAFVAETGYAVDFDARVADWHLRQCYIANPYGDALVWGGPIQGGALVFASMEFQARPFCYVGKFFVLPDARRSPAARDILAAVQAWAADRGCSHIFATATAGLSEREQRLFVNLMKRAGYRDCGPVLSMEV